MQIIRCAIILLLVSSIANAENLNSSDVGLKLENNRVVLQQGNNTYTFPSIKDDKVAGIRNVLQEDIDGDGIKEHIVGTQLREGDANVPYSCVLIGKPDREKLDIQKQIVTGDYFGDVQLFDVNKDGIKDIIIKGNSGMHWVDLNIVAWQQGKYVTLWDTGSPSGVFFEADKDGNAQVRIGIPLTGEKENWSYADEPDWEIWRWNGKDFIYTQSNTKETRISKLKDSKK